MSEKPPSTGMHWPTIQLDSEEHSLSPRPRRRSREHGGVSMGDSDLSRALEPAYFEAAERNETWSGLPFREFYQAGGGRRPARLRRRG